MNLSKGFFIHVLKHMDIESRTENVGIAGKSAKVMRGTMRRAPDSKKWEKIWLAR